MMVECQGPGTQATGENQTAFAVVVNLLGMRLFARDAKAVER
jgi:hypothetical protein